MTMKLSLCMQAITTLHPDDSNALGDKIAAYRTAGMDDRQSERAAVADLIAQAEARFKTLGGLLREQHPDLFVAANEPAVKKAPLYASRPVKNAQDIIAWAAAQGFKSTLPASDLHVTVAYSKTPMDGAAMPAGASGVSVLGGKRTVEPLGSDGAVVLKFTSAEMSNRWNAYRTAGASWDFDGYTPHITLTYDGKGMDLSKVEPYQGPIELGAETQEALNEDKADDYKATEVPTGALSTAGNATVVAQQSGDTAEIRKAKDDLNAALGELGALLSKNTRANITPEQEQALLPVLTRVFDAAFRLGYLQFKAAAKFVIDTIREKFGADVAGMVTLQHLQGAYISMSGRRASEGAEGIAAVAAVDSLDALNEPELGRPVPQDVIQQGAEPSAPSMRARLVAIAENIGVPLVMSPGGYRASGGMVEIPAEDAQVEGAQTADHVLAHELGHAIMAKRGYSFRGFPVSEVVKRVSNWDDLRVASKEFRPSVWDHNNDRIKQHARKPDEIVADAIASVLMGRSAPSLLRDLMQSSGLTLRDMGLVTDRPKADGISRAVAGGQLGINGEWYEGGQILPTSEDTIKGEHTRPSGPRAEPGPADTSVASTPETALPAAGSATVVAQQDEEKAGDNIEKSDRAQRSDGVSALFQEALEAGQRGSSTLSDFVTGPTFLGKLRQLLEVPSNAGVGQHAAQLVDANATTRESHLNGVRSHAQALADILDTKPGLNQRLGAFDVKTQRLVLPHVIALGKDGQVLKAVVQLVPVDVVNNLAARQLSPDSLFNDPAMVKAAVAENLGDAVPLGRYAADTLVRTIALAGAEVSAAGVRANLVGPARDTNPAGAANDVDLRHGVDDTRNDGRTDEAGNVAIHEPTPAYGLANTESQAYDAGEPDSNGYETDLFGDPIPAPKRSDRKAQPASSGVRGNVQPEPAVPGDTPAPDGEYHTRTVVGVTAQRKLGASVIKTAADAAAATRYLYKSAVERLDGIVTDKDGKPLAVIGGFKGAIAEAAVYPGTMIGEAMRIPGAAFVWFSHNHPSGMAVLSRADEALAINLNDAFRGSGVEPKGLMVVAGDRFAHSDTLATESIPASNGEATVPVIERELVPGGQQAFAAIDSPATAKQAARAYYAQAGVPGMILTDSQLRIVAWVPLPSSTKGKLRGTGGLNAIYRAVSEANAGGAILVHGGEFDTMPLVDGLVGVAQNIGAALGKVDVKPLDVINAKTGESYAEQGRLLSAGPVLSRPTTFYSALAKSIEASPMNAGQAGAWKQALKGMVSAGKVKADEVAWTGIEEWMDLQPGKVTKAQIAEFLKNDGAAGLPLFKRSGMEPGQMTTLAKALAAGLKSDITVLASPFDLTGDERRQMLRLDPNGMAEGVFFPDTGRTYLFSNNVHSAEAVLRVTLHESFHRGLHVVMGEEGAAMLRRIHATNKRVRDLAAAQMKAHGIDQLTAINEALAELAGSGEATRLNLWQQLVRMVREFVTGLAKLAGVEMEWTDARVLDLVARMTKAGLRGEPSVSMGESLAVASRVHDQTKTEAFKRWFGDSKVVDAEGKPMVVYHGTTSDFSQFDLQRGGAVTGAVDAREGFFFASNPKAADQFTWKAGDKIGSIMPVYLSLQNPAYSDLVLTGGNGRAAAMQIKDAKAAGHDGIIFRDSDMLDHRGQVLVAFHPEQIKSAIGNSGAFDPTNPNILLSRPSIEQREATDLINAATDEGALTTTGEKQKIVGSYRGRVERMLKRVDHTINGLGELPDSEQFLAQRYRALGRIAEVDKVAGGVRDVFGKADREDKAAIYAYLTDRDGDPATIRADRVREVAVGVKAYINKVGDALVERGLLSEESREEYRDRYLPRMYLAHLLSEGDWRAIGAGKKVSDMGYLKQRKDIPQEIRDVLLGEVKDPTFLAATALAKPMRDMALLDWLEQISQNQAWIFPKSLVKWNDRKVSAFWLKAEADALRQRARLYPEEVNRDKAMAVAEQMDVTAAEALNGLDLNHKDYRQIPNTARYGRLRGMLVRREIYDDLMGAQDFMPKDPGWAEQVLGYGGYGTKLTQVWKMSKVALNIPGQIRNAVSNAVLLQLSGVPLHKMPILMARALSQVRNGGVHWKVAQKYGVTESTFQAQEMFRARRDLLELEREMKGMTPWVAIKSLGAAVADMAGDAYQFTEAIFKTVKIMDGMEREGLSEEAAAIEAQKWLFDYSLLDKNIRYLRNAPVGAPFVTFTTKVLPRLAETALLHPQRFLPWAALMFGAQMWAQAMFGGDDDEWERLKKALPKWMQEKGHIAFLPWRDDAGRLQALDMSYFLPWSQWAELAHNVGNADFAGAMRNLGIFGGPVTEIITALKTGKDSFTKRDIVNEGDPPAAQAKAYIAYAWDLMMPPMMASTGVVSPMWLLGPEYGGKLAQATTGSTNRYGDERATFGQAASRLFGANVYGIDPTVTREQNLVQMKADTLKVQTRLRSKLRDRGVTPERAAQIIKDYNEETQARAKKLAEYEAVSRVPEFAKKVRERQ